MRAARHVRFARVEHFTDRADSGIVQMFRKTLEEFARGRSIVRMHFQPGIDERADQPRPNRSLMVSAVARTEVAAVNRFVFRIVRRERA